MVTTRKTKLLFATAALALIFNTPLADMAGLSLVSDAQAQVKKNKRPGKTVDPRKDQGIPHDGNSSPVDGSGINNDWKSIKIKTPTTCDCTIETTTYDKDFDPHTTITTDNKSVKTPDNCGNKAKSLSQGNPEAAICVVCTTTMPDKEGHTKFTECRLPM